MKWDDYLFLVMLCLVVPAIVIAISKYTKQDDLWELLCDCDVAKKDLQHYARIKEFIVGSTSIKYFVEIGIFKGFIVVIPGLPYKILGIHPKKISLSKIYLSENDSCMKLKCGSKYVDIKTVPSECLISLVETTGGGQQKILIDGARVHGFTC